MNTLSNYPTKIYIGKHENEKIYLTAPSWDCGWYWGFGYLGNNNNHYHVDGLEKGKNMYDGFIEHFGDSLVVRDSALWRLCELFKTFYILKQTAEVLGRGGAHYTSNPCESIIKNADEVTRINTVVLPAIFEEVYRILIPAQDNEKKNKRLLSLVLEGATYKVTEYMRENGIHTDDLKKVKGLTAHDVSVIHSAYWKEFHANKNK